MTSKSNHKNQRLSIRNKRLAIENDKLRKMLKTFGDLLVECGQAERAKELKKDLDASIEREYATVFAQTPTQT